MQTMGKLLLTLVTPVFIVVGLHCGIGMPDIDQRTDLLLHRSNHHAQSAHPAYTAVTRIKDRLWITRLCDRRQYRVRRPPRL